MSTAKEAPPVAEKTNSKYSEGVLGSAKISLISLLPAMDNYRKARNPKADAELLDSVKRHGVLTPILVRKMGEGKYRVIAGSRRVEAARAAGLKEIPARTFDVTDTEAAEMQLIENLQRIDAHPMDEAEGFSTLIRRKYSIDDVSMKVGKPRSYIVQRLQLLKLDAKIRDGFLKGKIELGHALELCKLQPADQKQAYENCFEHDSSDGRVAVSVPQLRGWIRDNLFRDLLKAPWDVGDENLLPKAGSCLKCPKRAGNQPDLFGDRKVSPGDTCTDMACFQSKREAFLKRTIEENEKKGTPLLKLAETWKPRGADLVGTDSYRELRNDEKDCPDTKRGILVEAWQGRMGEIRKVCTARRCPVHSGLAGEAPASKDKAKDDRRKLELDKAGRKTLLLTVLQSVHAAPTRKDLELVAESLLSNLHQDHRIVACNFFGWVDELRGEWEKETAKRKPKKGEMRPRFSPDLIQHASLRLKTMTDEQLSRFIIACSLAEDLSGPRWMNENRDVLLEAAEVRGIDTKEVLRQVRKDFEVKWKEDDAKKAAKKVVKKIAGKKVGTKKPANAKMPGKPDAK